MVDMFVYHFSLQRMLVRSVCVFLSCEFPAVFAVECSQFYIKASGAVYGWSFTHDHIEVPCDSLDPVVSWGETASPDLTFSAFVAPRYMMDLCQ